MSIDSLTVGELKSLTALLGVQTPKQTPFTTGKNYLIRTVTMAISGKVKGTVGDFLVLEQAAWVADTGRFNEALRDQNKFNEVEPFLNDCIVSLGSIVDATEIETLITKAK